MTAGIIYVHDDLSIDRRAAAAGFRFAGRIPGGTENRRKLPAERQGLHTNTNEPLPGITMPTSGERLSQEKAANIYHN